MSFVIGQSEEVTRVTQYAFVCDKRHEGVLSSGCFFVQQTDTQQPSYEVEIVCHPVISVSVWS